MMASEPIMNGLVQSRLSYLNVLIFRMQGLTYKEAYRKTGHPSPSVCMLLIQMKISGIP